MTEKTALRKLIRKLKNAGFTIPEVFDGEKAYQVQSKESQIVETVFQFDDAWIYVKKNKNQLHWIYVTLGNQEPADMFCDWSFSDGDKDGFNVLMDDFIDELNS